jgi:hypothetical protein
MEHSFPTRADADQFVTERYPNVESMDALAETLGNPVLLDRAQEVVVRIHDWSDDEEEPVVNIDINSTRDFIRDQDLVDQVGMLLDDGEPDRVGTVLAELSEIVATGMPSTWKDDSAKGLIATTERLKAELESALAIVNALRDRAARALWTEKAAAGVTLADVAESLYTKPSTLASMITADRCRMLDL